MTTKNTKDTMYAGNRRVLGFTIKDEAGAVLDLTGYTAEFKLAKLIGAKPGDALLTYTTAPNIVFNADRATGLLDVVLTQGATSAFLGPHYYELELIDASSNRNVVAVGEIEIKANI